MWEQEKLQDIVDENTLKQFGYLHWVDEEMLGKRIYQNDIPKKRWNEGILYGHVSNSCTTAGIFILSHNLPSVSCIFLPSCNLPVISHSMPPSALIITPKYFSFTISSSFSPLTFTPSVFAH